MPTAPTKTLETFPNPQPERDYIIEIESPEFTCLCPKTGQPDFATLSLEYVPDALCVELKSLKLYIWSFRDEGHFHEKVTNTILNDLVAATQPRYMRLRAKFNVRGGIYTTVTSEFRKSGWNPAPPPPDHLPREKQSAANAVIETAAAPAIPEASHVLEISPTDQPGGRSDRFRMLKRKEPAASPPPPPPPPKPLRDIYIGIDLGTTNCRAVAIDAKQKVLAQMEVPMLAPTKQARQITQDPTDWWKAVSTALQHVISKVDTTRIHRIAVSGTASILLCDKNGQPVSPGLMYNDRRAEAEADRIAEVAQDHPAGHGPNASLAKLLWLQNTKLKERAALVLHQADWISNRLAGRFGYSDHHTSLRLGFDQQTQKWSNWLEMVDIDTSILPQALAPGETLGVVSAETAKTFGLGADVEVAIGTTHGVAAFLSAGVTGVGQGVTVLGNTVTLQALAEKPIASRRHGVYSYPIGRHWLVGGTSNTGGNVLLQYFAPEQLRELDALLDAHHATHLNYYPLADFGELFPINDPKKEPKLEPLPGDSTMFLQGMLEAMARIETDGYAVLRELGVPPVKTVFTLGAGAQSSAWMALREQALGIKPKTGKHQNTAFGTALVAMGIWQKAYA